MGVSQLRLTSLPDSLWRDLQAFAHPADVPIPPWYRVYYGTLWAIVAERKPLKVVEIGVRAGYSSFVMLAACNCSIYAIDGDLDERTENTHCGLRGLFRHAVLSLPSSRFHFERRRSQDIGRLPPCDLVYLDGDHTAEGTRHDLLLAANAADAILCDDYDSSPGTRQALDRFVAECGWRTGYYGDHGVSLPGFVLLVKP